MAEYIKREDAIQVVKKYFTDFLELEPDICLDGIRSLPDADVVERKRGEWIPVTERLPKKKQIVCVSDGRNTWDYGQFRGAQTQDDVTKWHWKGTTIRTVKWWMLKSDALPEPPKEET